MATKQQIAQLRRSGLLSGCTTKQLESLARLAHVEQVDAGHVLLSQGSPASNLYILLAGEAAVRRNDRKIATIVAGDVVGELSVILGEARNATVTALTPIEMLVLDGPSLQRAIDKVPGLGWALLQAVASRLNDANARAT